MYETLSALVGRMGAPCARRLAFASVRAAGVLQSARPSPALRRTVMGLSFASPIGLAAGFDKRGTLYSALPGLGFGFAEIGSVVPRREQGRSPGLATVMRTLARHRAPHPIPLGLSISMNRDTPIAQSPMDYLACLQQLWQYADYITLNLGPRAGPDLHLAENRRVLRSVFSAVKREQWALASFTGRQVPVVVKIDQRRGNVDTLVSDAREYGLEGLLLSGEGASRLDLLERIASLVQGELSVISVGGVRTALDAQARLNAGADLVQVYTALVRSGPQLAKRFNQALLN